ncbi:MAG: hypothetical protein VYE22_17515 [Myxococcota bacterium]|nr:hypothetical protein [Myxococcota bacterium]
MLFLLLPALGCAVDPVSPEGKACPCDAEGWMCIGGTCLPEGSCGGGGTYPVTSFAAEWETPHVVHWTWELAEGANPAALEEVEVVIGEAPENAFAVERCACRRAMDLPCDPSDGVRVIGRDEYEELGAATLLDSTGGVHPVREVATLGLDADTRYAAALVTHDRELVGERRASAVSGVAFARTQPAPRDSIVIFDETRAPDSVLTYPPAECYPHDGGYRYEVSCPPPPAARGQCRDDVVPCSDFWPPEEADRWLCEPEEHPEATARCWQSFRWQSMDVATAPLSPGRYETAYLEIVATLGGEFDLGYVELETRLRDESGTDVDWEERSRGGARLRADGVEHVHEIPLRVLVDHLSPTEDAPHEAADLEGVEALTYLRLGANFPHHATVHFRRARLRF